MLEAIESALATAYKKEYGKKGQIVRAKLDPNSGKAEFSQVKIVVDDTRVKMPKEDGEEEVEEAYDPDDIRVHYNSEHHILIGDARRIKKMSSSMKSWSFRLNTKTTMVASPPRPPSR